MRTESRKQTLWAMHGTTVCKTERKAGLTLCKEIKTVSQKKETFEMVLKVE